MMEASALPYEHFLNYGSIMLNLFFIFQLKSIQNSGEKVKYWKEEYEEMEHKCNKAEAQRKIFEQKYNTIARENEKLKGHMEACIVHQEPLALQ